MPMRGRSLLALGASIAVNAIAAIMLMQLDTQLPALKNPEPVAVRLIARPPEPPAPVQQAPQAPTSPTAVPRQLPVRQPASALRPDLTGPATAPVVASTRSPARETPAANAPPTQTPVAMALPPPGEPSRSAPTHPASTQQPDSAQSLAAGPSHPRPANASAGPPPASPATPTAAAAAPRRAGPRIDASWAGNVSPPYPLAARRMGEQGEVRLDVHVAADGSVSEVRVRQSSGSPVLDQAAIDTVRNWKFRPATVDDQPVAEWYRNWKWVFKLEG